MAIPTLEQIGNEAAGSVAAVLSGKAGYEDIAKIDIGLKGLSATLGLFGDATKGVSGQLDTLSKTFESLYKSSDAEKAVLDSMSNLIKGNVAGAISSLVGEFTKAAYSAQDFQKSIAQLGQDRSFVDSIREQAFQLSSLGISYKQLKDANVALIEQYNASIRISERQSEKFEDNRKAMSQLIVFNQKFGVDVKQTADILNFTKDVMGGGTEQATKFSEQLEKFSDATGQKASKVFSEFNSSLDRFSVLTADKAITQFERLEATAARTGLGMNKLLESVKLFDDIETGFEKGGQLNRILSFMGGSFDTFTAIQADDDERARMIMEALAGVSDNFGKLGTEQAKRSMVAQLQQALPGFDTKTITGILNKSTDLSKDIAEISKMPLEKDTFTDRERAEKMIDRTTSKEFADAKDGLLEAGKAAQTFARNVKIHDVKTTEQFTNAVMYFDQKVMVPIVSANTTSVKNALTDFKTEAQKQLSGLLDNPSTALHNAGSAFQSAVTQFERIINTKPSNPTALLALPSITVANAQTR